MNKYIKQIKIKIKEYQYKKYIEEHISNVREAYNEMINCPDLMDYLNEEVCARLFERVQWHDSSKYSKEEFEGYRKYFYPINEMEKMSSKSLYDKAWEHHYMNNDHHWQHPSRQEDSDLTLDRKVAILENVCDWLAMGYKFKDRPTDYYNKNKDKINLPTKDKEFLEKILEGIDKHPNKDWRKNGVV